VNPINKSKDGVTLVVQDFESLANFQNCFSSLGIPTRHANLSELENFTLESSNRLIILDSQSVTIDSKIEIDLFRRLCSTYLIVIALGDDPDFEKTLEFFRLGAADVIVPGFDESTFRQMVLRIDALAQLRAQRLDQQAQLEKTNHDLEESLRVLEQDQIAGLEVQKSLMPTRPIIFGEYEISHVIIPSLYLSGDFVGYSVVLDRYLLFYFADVSGHGASSAFVTVLLQFMIGRIIRKHELERDYNALAKAPEGLIEHLNKQIMGMNLEKHMTLMAGSLDMCSHSLRYVTAAQLPRPVLIANGDSSFLPGAGKPVGLFESVSWKVHEVEFAKGSALVLFSDGVFDFLSKSYMHEKEDTILSRLADCPKSLNDLRKTFFLSDNDSPQDDVSVLLLRRNS
jgi:sigma-B regulation protein RsbU (phosphoserine phosphatase)